MTDQGQIPPDLFQSLRKMWMQDIAASQRAASIRNASLSSGGTFTIQGGAFLMEQENGGPIFYIGPLGPPRGDGSDQPGWAVVRADGTEVLSLYDANPTDSGGALNQALNWYDRAANVVVADDTNGGEGLARPWIPLPVPAPAAFSAWASTNATSWGVVAYSYAAIQHPKVWWQVDTIADAGTAGQVRLNINNGEVIGPVHSITTTETVFADTLTLPSGFFTRDANVSVSVEAQVTSGPGSVRVQTRCLYGRQT